MSENTASSSPATEQKKRSLHITLDSLTMFAEPRVRKDRKQLRLTFTCSNGYPNVNAETDEDQEGTKQNGWNRVSSRLNGPNWEGFLILIETALTQEPGWRRKIECFHTYKDGVQHETSQHVNDLVVGVDNQGLVYVSIIQEGRTTNKYIFGPTEWHNYRDADGNVISQKEINHIIARGTVNSLRAGMSTLIALDSFDKQVTKAGLPTPSVKPENQGGNNFNRSYGNNNNGGNNGFKKYNNNGGGGNGYNNNGGNNFKKQFNNNGGGGYNNGNGFKKPFNNNGGGGYNNGNRGGYNNNGGGNRGGFNDYKNQQNGGQQQQQSAKVETSDSFEDLDY